MRISDWSSDVCSSDLGGVTPTATIALADGGDCIKEDSVDNPITFTASAGDSSDELTTVVIELPGIHLGHIGHDGYFGIDPTEVQTVDFHDTATSTTITITLKPGVESLRSEEHTSELQSLMRTSYAAFCLKKNHTLHHNTT